MFIQILYDAVRPGIAIVVMQFGRRRTFSIPLARAEAGWCAMRIAFYPSMPRVAYRCLCRAAGYAAWARYGRDIRGFRGNRLGIVSRFSRHEASVEAVMIPSFGDAIGHVL